MLAQCSLSVVKAVLTPDDWPSYDAPGSCWGGRFCCCIACCTCCQCAGSTGPELLVLRYSGGPPNLVGGGGRSGGKSPNTSMAEGSTAFGGGRDRGTLGPLGMFVPLLPSPRAVVFAESLGTVRPPVRLPVAKELSYKTGKSNCQYLATGI